MHWKLEIDGDTHRVVAETNKRKKRVLPRILYIPIGAFWSRIILREGRHG